MSHKVWRAEQDKSFFLLHSQGIFTGWLTNKKARRSLSCFSKECIYAMNSTQMYWTTNTLGHTKKQCLLANFCMGLQKLRTFWSFSAFLILNFEEVALRKRSTFKGFERYQLHLPQVLLCSITAFCPQRLLLHSFLKIPHSQEVLERDTCFTFIPIQSKVG